MNDPHEASRHDASGARDGSEAAQGPGTDGLSRRRFLQAMGWGAAASSIPTQGLIGESAAPVRPGQEDWGPDAVPVTLRVNGRRLRMKLEPRVTLLDALRDHMQVDTQQASDVTGPKRVCDRSSCGACSVLLDGKLVYACSVLAIEAQDRDIVTVEGIGEDGDLHPVQEEFVHCDGLQCGFCTPGFVMASVALLRANASPSAEEIRRGLDGNICRCGTQPRVLEAVQKAADRLREGRE